MSQIVIFLTLLSFACAQTALNILADGSLPDGSSGTAVGTGLGADVAGTGTVSLDEDSSRSSVVLTATGGTTPTATVTVKPKPTVKPEVTVVKPANKVYYHPEPVCEDIKDKCEAIKEYKKCGFCVTSKYPTKGYGCSYVEEVVMKKKGTSKKEYEYETVITPKCKCEGTYILDAKACPSCETLLAKLLTCAGVKDAVGKLEIQIPEKCLKETGATEKVLIECGYIKAPKPEVTPVAKKAKEEKPKETVTIKKEKVHETVIITKKEKEPETVVITKKEKEVKPKETVVVKTPKPTTATATATASASGSGTAAAAAAASVVKGL